MRFRSSQLGSSSLRGQIEVYRHRTILTVVLTCETFFFVSVRINLDLCGLQWLQPEASLNNSRNPDQVEARKSSRMTDSAQHTDPTWQLMFGNHYPGSSYFGYPNFSMRYLYLIHINAPFFVTIRLNTQNFLIWES